MMLLLLRLVLLVIPTRWLVGDADSVDKPVIPVRKLPKGD